jgi:nicotinate-nucleotide--dimethylbenzimidazole phosphoribosyltransferase
MTVESYVERLEEILRQIEPLDLSWADRAQERLDDLTKPRGSLGRLEECARQYVAAVRTMDPGELSPAVLVFAADHGVTDEGISAFPKEVTHQMVLNILAGGAAINVLAAQVPAEVKVVDVGVAHDFGGTPNLVDRKVSLGTENMVLGPAMTRELAVKSLLVGADLAAEAIEDGCKLLAPGEMGIGNTTAASAVTAVFTGRPVAEVTGRGTGLDDPGLAHKVEVIQKAISVNRPDADDPLDVLHKVGGFELGAIAGLILGAAANRVPVVVDGFISTAGALIAQRLHPDVAGYLFAAHRSVEPGHQAALSALGLDPLLDMKMRLGEGTGAALGMFLLKTSLAVLNEMATFSSAGVSEKSG